MNKQMLQLSNCNTEALQSNLCANYLMNDIIKKFQTFYIKKQYSEVPQVKISSGIDQSVRFIGSHISVLKKYLEERKIPNEGLFITQPSIRTHNLKKYYLSNEQLKLSSYFVSLGILVKPEKTKIAINDFFEFLEKELFIKKKNIKIRISSEDIDLAQSCVDCGLSDLFEFNTRTHNYYRHKLGMPSVIGRNLNFAIFDQSQNMFNDVGNIIIIQKNNIPIATEIAFGAGILTKTIHGFNNVLDCFSTKSVITNPNLRIMLIDAILTSLVLCNEGLELKCKPTRNRILTQYVKSVSHLSHLGKVPQAEIEELMEEIESTCGFTNSNSAQKIINYIRNYENA